MKNQTKTIFAEKISATDTTTEPKPTTTEQRPTNQETVREPTETNNTNKLLRHKAGPTGIEPATPGLKVRCSSLTELRTRTCI